MDNQRLLLYASLAFVLFLIWQAWQQEHAPEPPPRAQAPSQTEQPPEAPSQAEQPPKGKASGPSDVPQAPPGAAKPAPPQAPAQTASKNYIHVRTDVLDVAIDPQGGDIRRTELLSYAAEADTPQVPFQLLSDENPLYVAQSGLVYAGETPQGVSAADLAPSHHATYSAPREEYRLAAGERFLRVPLTWQGPDGITVEKILTFERGRYLVDVEHVVHNEGKQAWRGRQYRQLRRGPLQDEGSSMFQYAYIGAGYYDGKYEKVDFEQMSESPLGREITGGWVAMVQQYFVSAWLPQPKADSRFYTKVVREGARPDYIIGMSSAPATVAPGQSQRFETELYVGPKLQEQLGQIAKGFELVVDYGIFTVLSKPLFWALDFIHSWVGNWGFAIIILTAFIKLVFYKLSETSYRSMARMRAVGPRMQTIRERYASDKQKMNQALMDLYKSEKINPLGGCLPILVQIPVFIALYWVLRDSVELRQADFMLWINDLSSRDPYFVLPVLMGATMVGQQKLNPAPLDPIQAKVMMIMPYGFTIFFAFFPAGLVLYWFVNNLLSILQQWVITRRMEQKAA